MVKRFSVKYRVIPAGVVLLLLIFVLYSNMSTSKKTVIDAKAVSVTVTKASYEKKIPKLTLHGSIEAKNSAIISAKNGGRVQQVWVEDGQLVQSGQELIQLENVELLNSVQKSQQSVQSAQAAYDNAQADYNRTTLLYNKGGISKQDLDSAQKIIRQAQSELLSAYASLESSEKQYQDAIIISPVTGRVAGKTVTTGQVVGSGVQLMTVEEMGQVYAVVNVEQKEMGRIQAGLDADITVDAFPDKVFKGKVEVINPVADTSNRMYKVKIKIQNDESNLKPGMFVQVNIAMGGETSVLAVPRSAVFQKQGLYYVFAAEGEKAVRKPVEVGEILGDKIEIKSGITENEVIVISNINNLKDGDSLMVSE